MKAKKNRVLFILLILILSYNLQAQISSSANFIKGGIHDAEKIISAYLLPVEQALSYDGANNNMLIFKNSTDNHFRIGIGFDFTNSFINSDNFTYDINDLNLTEFEPKNPNATIAQTFAGNESTITLQTKDKYYLPTTFYPFYQEIPVLTIESPMGKNVTYIPFPAIHLFAEKNGNSLEFKILPPFKIKQSTIGLFGIGVNIQHNLETSLSFVSNNFVDFYISGGIHYNQIIYYLDVKPNEDALTFSDQSDNGPYDNQKFIIGANSIPVRFTITKPIHNFSFFVSGGYDIMNSIVKMVGKYPVYSTDPTNQFQIIAEDIEVPIEYLQNFNNLSFDTGLSYQSKNFLIELKYAHSYYKNIDISLAFMFGMKKSKSIIPEL